jgi:hypothetical protein
MRTIAGLLLTALLTMSTGCARTDWIDRTLVTVDVTGTWSGRWAGSSPELLFELEQQGSTVKGFMRYTAGSSAYVGARSGPIEGTVAGDVFHFRQTAGNVEGELTVSGDEMNGRATQSLLGSRPFSLRRVDPSSLPASPPR